MAGTPLLVKPEDYPSAIDVVATKVTVLASAQKTEGQEFTY